MQTDMHYYGTYAMARAAGLHETAAHAIALSAEYVDDSDAIALSIQDGTFFEASATAHHPVNKQNLDLIDQRKIWVPFHFIPGNVGDTYEERLVCLKDSPISRELVEHHATLENQGFAVELMGITAHVYADTFSHYGFSGISSDVNRVDLDSIELRVNDPAVLSYITGKTKKFIERCIAPFPNAVALGHGGVSTYPDRPYLTWSFRYQVGNRSSGERRNPETFLDACEKLHGMFEMFGETMPQIVVQANHRSFHAIRDSVARVLAVEGEMNKRVEAWQTAAREGSIFPNAASEAIPAYEKSFSSEVEIIRSHTAESVRGTTGYAFLRAAQYHRDYVLDELLPKHGLHVLLRA